MHWLYECSEADWATIPKLGAKNCQGYKGPGTGSEKGKHAPLTVFDCLSETAPENANRCECQNDYAQLRAELARRFDPGDTPSAAQCSVISRLNCLRTCKILNVYVASYMYNI